MNSDFNAFLELILRVASTRLTDWWLCRYKLHRLSFPFLFPHIGLLFSKMSFEVSALGPRPVLLAVFVLLCGALLKFLFEGYRARMRFVELQRQGMVSIKRCDPLTKTTD